MFPYLVQVDVLTYILSLFSKQCRVGQLSYQGRMQEGLEFSPCFVKMLPRALPM